MSGCLGLFGETNKIESNIINFPLQKDKFDEFQTSLPTKFTFTDNIIPIQNYNLNLIKGNNTYHIFNGKYFYSFELLFYGEESVEIITEDGIKINEFDKCSKFQRFSLINLNSPKIKVNGFEINLLKFLPLKRNSKANSFHYSFYDITQKYIVSKQINIIENLNMEKYYQERYSLFKMCSEEIINYSLQLKEDMTMEFEKDKLSELIMKYQKQFLDVAKLNLNLPNEKLSQLLNEDKYIEFFFNFSKLYMLLIIVKCNDINRENFIYMYDSLEKIYKKFLSDNNLLKFEKILLLLNYTGLFNDILSCEKFKNINYHYIKIAQADENSSIKLAKKFLSDFITNLNEESPSFFHLIEINSGYGYFEKQKFFLFDMISLSDLKIHLNSNIPTVIGFFSQNSSVRAITNENSGTVSINEKKLFEDTEIIDIDKNISNEKESQVKSIAMKISEELMHESFGHKKFQFHSIFCNKPKCSTPLKCFDIKSKKKRKLVGEFNSQRKEYINILSNPKRSDSGNYFESSFGKLSGLKLFTFSFLKRIKNQDKLLDPLLFTQKDNLEKLQKYSYYKCKYEFKNGKKDELKKYSTFEDEYYYLVNKYENDKIKEKEDLEKNLIEEKKENNQEKEKIKEEEENVKKKKKDKVPESKEEKKYMSKKRKREETQTKKNENTDKINPDDFIIKRIRKNIIKIKIRKKNKKKVSKKINGKKYFEILLDDTVTDEIKTKYLNALLENLSRIN